MKTNPSEGVVHGADSAERIHRNQPSQRQTGDSYRKPFEIRLDEIDFNGHLHNTKYLEYCSYTRYCQLVEQGWDLRRMGEHGIGAVSLAVRGPPALRSAGTDVVGVGAHALRRRENAKTDSACLEANSRPGSQEPACQSTGRRCGDGATKWRPLERKKSRSSVWNRCGVGGGANGRHIVGGDLAAAIVDEPDVDRTIILARPSFDGRSIRPGKVGVAPLL
jgi:hypothetical protein